MRMKNAANPRQQLLLFVIETRSFMDVAIDVFRVKLCMWLFVAVTEYCRFIPHVLEEIIVGDSFGLIESVEIRYVLTNGFETF